MKKLYSVAVFLFVSVGIFGQLKYISGDPYCRIEISDGGGSYSSIKLMEEGLICKRMGRVAETSYPIQIFIPLDMLDEKKLLKLQKFILSDSIFFNDSVFSDTVHQPISATPWINIFIIHPNYKSNIITWEMGYNEKLQKCVELLNDLVPDKYKEIYYIKPLIKRH